ncbi:hypothetical protein GGR92_005255 [Spirosoma lacussanchae]|uniref:hypothetical protein n=1 Tax=Spirosoma lacussanchae TaxID=1884249 RepID=UPI001108407D|nr:hypothetical protein [Spirosoma lacussanchae]
MPKQVRVVTQHHFTNMSADRQHGYLLLCRHWIRQGLCRNCPHWLYFLTLAYFTGNTNEITATPTMTLYRDLLLNQVLDKPTPTGR